MLVDSQAIARALDPDRLLEEAAQISGLTDFGDPRSIDALRVMVRHYVSDVKVHAAGLEIVRNTTIRQLVNRARFAEDLKRHPEILDEDVSDPIVILGPPRSGTTKMHRMMGVDPNLLKTYTWQLTNPAPFPDARPGEPDPRIAAASVQKELINASNTNEALRAAHLYGAEEVQEDIFLYGLTFNCPAWSAARPTSPSYYDFLTQQRTEPSELDNYRYIASIFQYLQWQQGGRRGRRWLMKHTSNHGRLDELLAVYPKATLVHIHRNPLVSIPSLLKLMLEWFRPTNPYLKADEVAPYIIRRLKDSMDSYLEARERLGLDDRIYDLNYEQIRSDPMPAIREIYRRADHELTPESEALMLQYERDNEQGKHGAHSYSLEQFGITEAMLRQQFGAYMDRFIKN